MITKLEMIELLKQADALNLGSLKLMQADLFCEVINQTTPELTASQARQALLRIAAQRTTENRGQFLTPGDWLKAIRELKDGEVEAARERLRQEIARNGAFQAEGIEDATSEVTWRQEATKAFMAGMSRDQAEKHAWHAIGMTPPAIETTTKRQLNLEKIGR